MSAVLRLLALALVCVLVPAGTALANHLDPQKRIRPADQARARAMLLTKADLGAAYRSQRSSGQSSDVDCAGLDESDLTLTGEAESPTFTLGVTFVTSLSEVYESAADSNASWRRATSAAGEKCALRELRRQFERGGIKVESLRRAAFPRLAERTIAYRLVASSQGVRVFVDVVALQQSRAQAVLLLGSAIAPVPKADEVRLARVVEGRMVKAMRGSS